MKTNLWIVAAVAFGCGKSDFPSSGVQSVDQTAQFLRTTVTGLRNSKRFTKASEIASYLTSAQGKAEYIPPSSEFEKDAAENYRGPRPADRVAIDDSVQPDSLFEYFIVVSSDDQKGTVILTAFRKEESSPFFTWTF